ncbi:unnamed protein product [Blepharisma stoltei]|uniref:Uncharacterized protein n=1 Tax=Blepharisma stoltei TaxID=1481888 RepID=A0AAU9I6S7_9CILI|nr:unnamed protein product [Blepharisma stoltei]
MDKSKSGFFIAVIGCSQVGKTALVARLVKDMFIEEHQPTMTQEIQTTLCSATKRRLIRLFFLDLIGNNYFQSFATPWIGVSQAVLMLFDTNSMSSFNQIQGPTSLRSLENIMIFLVGTKTDTVYQREVSYEQAANKAKELNAIYIEISTKSKKNLEQMLKIVSQSLLRKY